MSLLLDFGHSGIDPLQISKGGQAPSGNWVKSGEEVEITKLPSLLCRGNKAAIRLPFSCYLVAGKMAKVEYYAWCCSCC
jgi:hypothetical protein